MAKYKCQECTGVSFRRARDLDRHVKTSEEHRNFCPKGNCFYYSHLPDAVENHCVLRHGDFMLSLQCHECPRRFVLAQSLAKHLQVSHIPDISPAHATGPTEATSGSLHPDRTPAEQLGPPMKDCVVCVSTVPKALWEIHWTTSPEHQLCPFCDTPFSTGAFNILETHFEVHHIGKFCLCKECLKAVSGVRTRPSDLPTCIICKASFNLHNDLLQHACSKHRHLRLLYPAAPTTCTACGLKLANKIALMQHRAFKHEPRPAYRPRYTGSLGYDDDDGDENDDDDYYSEHYRSLKSRGDGSWMEECSWAFESIDYDLEFGGARNLSTGDVMSTSTSEKCRPSRSSALPSEDTSQDRSIGRSVGSEWELDWNSDGHYLLTDDGAITPKSFSKTMSPSASQHHLPSRGGLNEALSVVDIPASLSSPSRRLSGQRCKAAFGSTVERDEHHQLEHAAHVECNFCGILVAEADWKEHWESSVRHQRCSKCDLYFEGNRAIGIHGGVPHENLYCMTCKIFFHTLTEIREHQTEYPDHLRCPKCFKPFETSQRIGNHMEDAHPELLRVDLTTDMKDEANR
ncbi:hypothetical protein EIP91_001623 [Steccherinum ochraceum]|uniref:C2H2-type domain-containing protein n=1 Tax=Steccherinum ochraceum TaxID=92696 RepID=A0A4R0RDK7_9APHY|nr:hypothetical protein EIP91_001623 [Steccherinum ochraceum]